MPCCASTASASSAHRGLPSGTKLNHEHVVVIVQGPVELGKVGHKACSAERARRGQMPTKTPMPQASNANRSHSMVTDETTGSAKWCHGLNGKRTTVWSSKPII